ncbi:retrieval of early ER protein Rer1 [Hymenopellis radicata]|nr:retrieval of early ER protein Rer1 [Hymenopellis radicata]
MSDTDAADATPVQNVMATYSRLQRQYQQILDRWTPFMLNRWLATGGLLCLFMLRIVLAQGVHAHAIYLLNLLLAFLQPKFDPSLQEDLLADEIEEGGEETRSPLPSQRDDEFRPFAVRYPRHHSRLLATTSEVFDVPVYWPILVVYFFVLFALTMRRQIQHMIKYKYIPFDIGRKTRYGNGR